MKIFHLAHQAYETALQRRQITKDNTFMHGESYNEKQGRFMAALNGDIENFFVGVCGLDDSRWIGSKKDIGNVYDNPELLKGGAE